MAKMAPEKRTELIAVRLTPAEVTMLTELVDADGIYQSDVLRMLLRRAHTERFGAPAGKTTTRKSKPRR
jgi:hypothetical protein